MDVNGIQLNVEMEGEGPPLLLLHGFTGSIQSWRRILPALRNRYKVVLVDMIGHGLSESPVDFRRYSMEHAVEDLLQLLAQLGLPKVNLLGYSMGGRCALQFAVQAPERVHTLILESSSPGIAAEPEREARRRSDEALAGFIIEQGVAAFVDRWTSLALFATQQALPDFIKNEVRCQRLQNQAQGLANSLRGMGTGVQPSWWGRLQEIRVPTLLLVGEHDAKFRRIGLSMEKIIPGSTLQIIPSAGHTVHLEQPAVFTAAVMDFLSLHNPHS
ncbi:2-succinyl-6-hydroxy-2,4-cyclohexadiene-1-carboxylate synthase [Lucifera butyrica]|nr:2-succinyl-6-hydroxy-2,4-cyclohexadiene-1-carboxylate synthase [Lucifera butyrica]